MVSFAHSAPNSTATTVISVDAMGGDHGPVAVVGGMAKSAAKNPKLRFIAHGNGTDLEREVARHAALKGIVDIRHADDVVDMHDRPSHVMRHGAKTSMWSALDSVREKEASVAVSCGTCAVAQICP